MRKSPKKNPGGRPKTVLSSKQIKEVESLAQRLIIEQIADYLGIGQSTFFEICKRQPEVSEAYKRGKTKAVDYVVSKLMDKVAVEILLLLFSFLKLKVDGQRSNKLI